MLARLVLTDFRNHASLTLEPGPGFVVLTGENGAGKTNVLEAVSLLAPGKGLRRANLSAMARQGGPGGFGVAATLADDTAIATGASAAAPERRLVRIQGASVAANALAEWLTILWLTPAMDRLFVDTASERRRFLDRLTMALVPAHATHAARYEAAMRARNRLLAEESYDPAWLTALEAGMAEHGAALDGPRRSQSKRSRRGPATRAKARLAASASRRSITPSWFQSKLRITNACPRGLARSSGNSIGTPGPTRR
jgi:DNA replication and repair protein RecF